MSKTKRDILMYAAGESQPPGGSAAKNLRPWEEISSHLSDLEPKEISLLSLCRDAIRNRLVEVNPNENLIFRVPRLGLPSSLTKYLLYDVPTDEEAWSNEGENCDCGCDRCEQKPLTRPTNEAIKRFASRYEF